MKTKADLREKCRDLRRHILSRGWAEEEEFEEFWPEGGKRAAYDDWLWCSQQCFRLLGRAEWAGTDSERADERLLDAARWEPEPVELSVDRVVEVHPKSMDALLWFREQDYALRLLGERLQALRRAIDEGRLSEEDAPNPISGLNRGAALTGELTAKTAYAATLPGPRLIPHEEHREEMDGELEVEGEGRRREPVPPGWVRELPPTDYVRINSAFWEVNATRLEAVETLLGPTTPGEDGARRGSMSWNVFYGTLADRLGKTMEELVRDEPLAALLSQVQLASHQPGKSELSELEGRAAGTGDGGASLGGSIDGDEAREVLDARR